KSGLAAAHRAALRTAGLRPAACGAWEHACLNLRERTRPASLPRLTEPRSAARGSATRSERPAKFPALACLRSQDWRRFLWTAIQRRGRILTCTKWALPL